MDYSDYLSDASPGMMDSLQKMVNDTFTMYMGVLCGQPFEMAKTVLQVRRYDDAQSGTKREVSSVSKHYGDVRIQCITYRISLTYFGDSMLPTRIPMNQRTLHPRRPMRMGIRFHGQSVAYHALHDPCRR